MTLDPRSSFLRSPPACKERKASDAPVYYDPYDGEIEGVGFDSYD